jgi:hypothetical protein
MSTKTTKADAQATAKEEAAEQTFLTAQAGKKTKSDSETVLRTSSTETCELSPEDFWKIKLTA